MVTLPRSHPLDDLALVDLHLPRRERVAASSDLRLTSISSFDCTRRSNLARTSGKRVSPIPCFRASRSNARSSTTAVRCSPLELR